MLYPPPSACSFIGGPGGLSSTSSYGVDPSSAFIAAVGGGSSIAGGSTIMLRRGLNLFGAGGSVMAGTVGGGGTGAAGLEPREALDEDTRQMVDWVKRGVRLKGYLHGMWTDDHDAIAARFLTTPESQAMIAYIARPSPELGPNGLPLPPSPADAASSSRSSSGSGASGMGGDLVLLPLRRGSPVCPLQFVYWAKRSSSALIPLRSSTIRASLSTGTVSDGGVDALARLVGSVFLPAVAGSSSSVKGGASAASEAPAASGPGGEPSSSAARTATTTTTSRKRKATSDLADIDDEASDRGGVAAVPPSIAGGGGLQLLDSVRSEFTGQAQVRLR